MNKQIINYVQYPSAFFDKNHHKPTLNIELTTDSLMTVRSTIQRGIKNGNLTVDHVNTYLYLFYKEKLSEKLEGDWTSYKQVIGQDQTKVSPLSLLEVKAIISKEGDHTETEVSELDDHWMVMYVVSIYRLIRASNDTHRDILIKKVNKLMLSANLKAEKMNPCALQLYSGWQNNSTYNKLIAALDMFLYKFNMSDYAYLRIGTLGSRYRDCAVFLACEYILKLTGMEELEDLADWVFVETVAEELTRVMKEGEELYIEHSYFPYQVDLGIVRKSAYSTVENPCLHVFIHSVGILLGEERSMNARSMKEVNVQTILPNAKVMAYAYSSKLNLEKAKDGWELTPDEEVEFDEDEDEYKERNAKDWNNRRRFRMTRKMKNFIKGQIQKIKDPRDGTIAKHLLRIC